MMSRHPSYDAQTRASMLQAGLYQRASGEVLPLRSMVPEHLVYALLKALREQEPTSITRPLASEIKRRRLVRAAYAEARRRQEKVRPL